ncbi:MAG: hypothetical protein IJO06_11215 [Thermoguttaceae bacterium]|nr:hypothetical protein [Thermoguttaceae bacterium]
MTRLLDVYPSKNPRVAVNRAIRKEIPGGAEILDALAVAAPLRYTSYAWGRVYKNLLAARDAATQEILKRYEFVDFESWSPDVEREN